MSEKKNKETPCCEMSLNCCSGGLIDRDSVSTSGGNCRRVSSGGLGRSFIVFIKSYCLYITPVAAPPNSCWNSEYRLKLVQIIYNDSYKTLEDRRYAKCIGADIASILDRP